jgi:branched-chain amino acid aminotransferase
MSSTKRIWLDGELVDWSSATVHVSSFGLNYGIGFFEGVRCYLTPDGPAIFRLHDHIRRLARSASIYMVRLPYDVATLVKACKDVVRDNGMDECYIRPIIFLGEGEHPLTAPYRTAIICMEGGPFVGAPKTAGIAAKISSFHRMTSNSIPPSAKATGQYLNSFLALTEALSCGFDEAILLNSSGYVADGWAHNVFVVRDSILVTPPVSAGALAGVVRDAVMVLAREDGIEVREDGLTRTDLYGADECFMTGTAAGILPVLSVDRRPVAGSTIGPVTTRLTELLNDATHGRSGRWPQWRELVG